VRAIRLGDGAWDALQARTPIPAGLFVDVGGEGAHTGAINVNPSPIGSADGLVPGRAIPNHVAGSSTSIPLPDASVARLVLERSTIEPGTGAEIARVMRPGGEVRIQTSMRGVLLHREILDAFEGARFVQRAVPGIYRHEMLTVARV